jgi:hypothetical protein
MFLVWIFASVFTWACQDCANHITPEVYTPIKAINLSVAGCTPNGEASEVAQQHWFAYDDCSKAVWFGNNNAENVVVLDAEDYTIRVILPYVTDPHVIAFSDTLAFVTDYAKNQVRIYDKEKYTLEQVLSVSGGPDAVYWDSVTGGLWVTTKQTNSLLVFLPLVGTDGTYQALPTSTISLPRQSATSVPGVGVLTSGVLYQPVDNVIYVVNVHFRTIVSSIFLPLFPGAIRSIGLDTVAGNLVVGTNAKVVYLVSTYDSSIQATISVLGTVNECAIPLTAGTKPTNPALQRAYFADSEGLIDVIDLQQQYLQQNFTTAPFVATQTLTALGYPDSTEIWVYDEEDNAIIVYEWNRH